MSAFEWWNRTRYRLYAPIYDVAARPYEAGRKRAIERLDLGPDDRILLAGCGTGADLEYIPDEAKVAAVDVVPAMVSRTEERARKLGMDVDVHAGDAGDLPFEDDSFDAVALHLILSVAPEPERIVAETARVLAPQGRVSIFDKFVPADESPSIPRRLADPFATALFSSLTRSLEPMLAGTDLVLDEREPYLHGFYEITVARPAEQG
jgi:phosphatidylethanolamine/phosphatidyl-N-methylethanolamine N-methyltransferase